MAETSIFTIQRLDATDYLAIAGALPEVSYRQLPAYAEHTADAARAELEYVAVSGPNGPLAVACVRIKCVGPLPIGLAYIDHGPVTLARNEIDAVRMYAVAIETLRNHYTVARSLRLRITPPTLAARGSRGLLLQAHGFSRAPEKARMKILVDTSRDLATIRESLNSTWRNELSQAEAFDDLVITTTTVPEHFTELDRLLGPPEARKNFIASQRPQFLAKMQRRACGPDKLRLYLAHKGAELVSAHLVAPQGAITVSLMAATTAAGHAVKASNLIQWATIKDCVREGKAWYDTGAINPVDNPGVTEFKRGMGGLECPEDGAFEAMPSGAVGILARFAEQAYRAIKPATDPN